MELKITLVVAMNKERVIGVDNRLPWHIPEDLAYVKKVTLGKPVIMGRKTFESRGRVLPGRKNIVITRNRDWSYPGVEVVFNLEQALQVNSDASEVCIIGGGEVFSQALTIADYLYLTVVDVTVENPTAFFPPVDYAEWQLLNQDEIVSQNNIRCVFNQYIRKKV